MSIISKKDAWFPKMPEGGFAVTSEIDPRYNCIAWAAGDTARWWEPSDDVPCYWPESTPREYTRNAFEAAFGTLGYSVCDSAELEAGYEKIAIYSNRDGPQHAARQLPDGSWTSKIGRFEDIRHFDLDSLFCKEYGSDTFFMKRPLEQSPTLEDPKDL